VAEAAPDLALPIYGCGPDEAVVFRRLAPRFGVTPTIVEQALCDANLRLARGHRFISVSHRSRLGQATLLALSQAGVECISTRSVGYDHIDVDGAASLGISVQNVDYSPDSVADFTLMLMLMVIRGAKSAVSRAQLHDYRLNESRGRELRDLTVGVVGTGRIGLAVMDRLRGFGGRVLAHDRHPTTSAEYVALETLLARSDVVTLHTPLDAGTRHLLDRRCIELMKPGAFIINTGRGPLLDAEALLAALEGGRLGGAALDVLEGEAGVFYSDLRQTPVGHPLLLRLQQLPNVVITPHTAYYTDHALNDTVENTLTDFLRFEGGTA
jgi:D-specific alpha-keto acid dehydrogenase